jgi:hypothetical protein
MARQGFSEFADRPQQLQVWKRMMGILAEHPGALLSCNMGGLYMPNGTYAHGMTAEWQFHVPANMDGVRKHYKISGVMPSKPISPDTRLANDVVWQLSQAAWLLQHADRAQVSRHPRRFMRNALLGVDRPGITRNKALPLAALHDKVAEELPSHLDTVGVFLDKERDGHCAGMETVAELMRAPTYDNGSEGAAGKFAQLDRAVELLSDPTIVAGPPITWHRGHGDIFMAGNPAHTA